MTNIIRIPANSQAYLFAKRDAVMDKFDVTKFRYNYVNTPPLPPAWAYWPMDDGNWTDLIAAREWLTHYLTITNWGPTSGSGGSDGATLTGVGEWWRQYYYWNGADWVFLWEPAHYFSSSGLPSALIHDIFPSDVIDTINALDSSISRPIGFRIGCTDGVTVWDGGSPTGIFSLNADVLSIPYSQLTHMDLVGFEVRLTHTNTPSWETNWTEYHTGKTTRTWDYRSRISSAPGKVNTCMAMDGSYDDYLHFDAAPNIVDNAPQSYSFWFKVTSTAPGGYFMWYGDQNISIFPSGGQLDIEACIGSSWMSSPSYDVLTSLGEWHHFVMTYSFANKLKVYLDNVLVGTGPDDEDYGSGYGIQVLEIWGNMQILIDQVRIFEHELSVADVATLWNGGVGI